MMDTIQQLRQQANKLLEENRVEMVIGFGRGTEPTRTTPIFITSAGEVDKLTWSPFCANNLVKYLVDYRNSAGNVAVLVKGCDSRAVNRLLDDNQIERSKVIVLGIPCSGQLDWRKVSLQMKPDDTIKEVADSGESFTIKTDSGNYSFDKKDYLLQRCLVCENPNPVVADVMLGSELPVKKYQERFTEVDAVEAMSADEKSEYWDKQFGRCLRCYACRNVCTVCTCRLCLFDQMLPVWVTKKTNLSENTSFHLIRAFHVAGRCVDCGECDRICPVDIPLRKLNSKLMKDLNDLFDSPTPGSQANLESPLGEFSLEDPEEFM